MEISVSCDWFQGVVSQGGCLAATDLVKAAFPGEWTEVPGRWGYSQAWQNGTAMIQAGHQSKNSYAMVSLPGSALGLLPDACGVARSLIGAGVRPSRVDVALDLRGSGLSVGLAKTWCDSGHLLHAKSYEHVRSVQGDAVSGETLYMGSRRGGRQFVRFYDKGLESRTELPGSWLRWELSARGEHAEKLAETLGDTSAMRDAALAGSGFGPAADEWGHRRGETPAEWLAFLGQVGAVPCRITVPQQVAGLADYLDWLAGSVAPILRAVGSELGLTSGGVLDALLTGRRVMVSSDEKRCRDVVRYIQESADFNPAAYISEAM